MTRFFLAACSFAFVLTACAPLPQRESRAAQSSYGCMQAALRDRLPQSLPDAQTHCIAAGLIARHCSVTEAGLASLGKELRDLLGPGDAQWRDLEADRRGVDCARSVDSDAGLQACCLQTAPQPNR
ncbi:MAG TPA: hypothetical protein PKE27_11115 [Povalibacter sp.]|uniref:hypothetical protein n=1 Tax=Povalibacter sp. TaxID=1962978 RepID=UPI002B63B1EB|nr:hypothetical protein [Povalibacter sp.]HMN45118.1 hypothetical protein [Povalibacter sp.]